MMSGVSIAVVCCGSIAVGAVAVMLSCSDASRKGKHCRRTPMYLSWALLARRGYPVNKREAGGVDY